VNILDTAISRQLDELEGQLCDMRQAEEEGRHREALATAEKALERLAAMERGFTCFLAADTEPLNRMRRNLFDGLVGVGEGRIERAAGAVEDAVAHIKELMQ
jgi:hypothetical protein